MSNLRRCASVEMIPISCRCLGVVTAGEACSPRSLLARMIELMGVFSSWVILLMKLVRCSEKLISRSRKASAEKPKNRTRIVETSPGSARLRTSARVGARSSDTAI